MTLQLPSKEFTQWGSLLAEPQVSSLTYTCVCASFTPGGDSSLQCTFLYILFMNKNIRTLEIFFFLLSFGESSEVSQCTFLRSRGVNRCRMEKFPWSNTFGKRWAAEDWVQQAFPELSIAIGSGISKGAGSVQLCVYTQDPFPLSFF